MRVLVCGGRTYADVGRVAEVLDAERAADPNLSIGCGYDPKDDHFQGADELAYRWAKERGVPGAAFPAHWRTEGRSAGPRRNARMLAAFCPEKVIAFDGGTGTEDMTRRAIAAGVTVIAA